jgi:hypothetical protein
MEIATQQQQFFQCIAEKYYSSDCAALVKDLQDHLHLTQAPVYKRIQGKHLLDCSEVTCLLEYYDIPIEILFTKKITPPLHIIKK